MSVLLSFPALADVPKEVHKLCIEAKDYLGCVKAMTTEQSATSEIGNKCQTQFAYIGDGNCQRVGCRYGWWLTGSGVNNQIVAGKSDWKCPRQFRNGVFLTGSLILEEVAAVGYDKNCPPVEPTIGWNSSCETAPKNWRQIEAEKAEAIKPKCDSRLHKYNCNYEAYLDANPAMQKWAELNPELSAKEQVKLEGK
ncbi:hypothetical protein [Synechococcus sp. CB0205]|uniref:hypothetical protein n=1 Tax=Synechococcus sp. CB0205 TaxID=232363 RepID=UPI0012EA23EF|nr:hypothetical protein [Synechococcus sp. CB0205]